MGYRKPLEESAEPRAEAMEAAAAALSGRKANQSAPEKEPESDKERRDRFAALMASKQEDRKKRMTEASRWAKEKKKCEDEKMEAEPEPEPEPAASCVRLGECRQGCNLPVWFAEWNEQEQQMELEIMLPGVSSVGELDLDCSEAELEVEGGGY